MRTTAILFTRFGLGHAPEDLQLRLAGNFLALIEAGEPPAALLFYGEGVKLVCEGSPVLDALKALQARGANLLICRTCLDYFHLTDAVRVGAIGGMPGIVEAMARVDKVVSV
jgi:intracellular sulfur oxidation DsrE/DsrF family protein